MKVKVKKTISYKGNIIRAGETIDMDEKSVKAFGKDYVAPVKNDKGKNDKKDK